jgi:hypothetical protein
MNDETEKVVEEREITLAREFANLFDEKKYQEALNLAEEILKEFPKQTLVLIYKTDCLDMLNRAAEAREWVNFLYDNCESYSFSTEEDMDIFERMADIEISMMYASFTGFDKILDTRFPTSKQEYLTGKKYLDKAIELNVGSKSFKERREKAELVLEKASKRVFLGTRAVYRTAIGLACFFGFCLVMSLLTPKNRIAEMLNYYLLFTFYFGASGISYRLFMWGPAYRLNEKQQFDGRNSAMNNSMWNIFSNTQNSKIKTTYTSGRVEHSTGNEQLNVGITFLGIKLGILMFKVIGIPKALIRNKMSNIKDS